MKKRIVFFVVITVLLLTKSNAQELHKSKDTLQLELIKIIPGRISYFNVDLFNNIYIINSQNQLKKFNEKGDSIGVYNDLKKFGTLSYIDVSNPFKILAFFNQYKYLITLDQLLTFKNAISLRSKDFFNVTIASNSYDNQYWIFDERDFKLKKIDDNGNLLLECGDLRIISQETPKPSAILENKNQVIIYDENKGFFVFDFYGSYKNNIPFLKWKSPSVYNNRIIGFDGDKIYAYELNSLNLQEFQLPNSVIGYQSLKMAGNHLYVLKDETIYIYSIK